MLDLSWIVSFGQFFLRACGLRFFWKNSGNLEFLWERGLGLSQD